MFSSSLVISHELPSFVAPQIPRLRVSLPPDPKMQAARLADATEVSTSRPAASPGAAAVAARFSGGEERRFGNAMGLVLFYAQHAMGLQVEAASLPGEVRTPSQFPLTSLDMPSASLDMCGLTVPAPSHLFRPGADGGEFPA